MGVWCTTLCTTAPLDGNLSANRYLPHGRTGRWDSNIGLGNGKTRWRLPVWLKKNWGDWTTYGGAGYMINRATGQKNYPFAGWLLQKDPNEMLTLGGEVFARSKDTEDGQSTSIWNFIGYYQFTLNSNLLFFAGHNIGGESHTVAYLGLWWGWGG